MVTSHRPGKLKQKNKKHKTGKHRSKGQIAIKNKGRIANIPVKRSKNLVLDKSTRLVQKKQQKQMKQNRLNNVKTMLGGEFVSKIITFITFDNFITMQLIIEEIANCCPDRVIIDHPMNKYMKILTNSLHNNNGKANVNKAIYLNFVPYYTFLCVNTSFAISDCVVLCSTVGDRISIPASQIERLHDIKKCHDKSLVQLLHYLFLPSSVDIHTKEKYIAAYCAIMGHTDSNTALSNDYHENNIYDNFSQLFNIALSHNKALALEKIYSNIKTPDVYLRPYMIVSDIVKCSAYPHNNTLECQFIGVLLGSHLNSTNKFINFPGYGDFAIDSVRTIAKSAINFYKNKESSAEQIEIDGCYTFNHCSIDVADESANVVSADNALYSIAPEIDLADFDATSNCESDSNIGESDNGSISDACSDGTYCEDTDIGVSEIRYCNGQPCEYIPLKEQLRGYRGMDSFKNSYWDPNLDLPPEYAKICKFVNFDKTKKLSVFDETIVANSGNLICITVKEFPLVLYETLMCNKENGPTVGYFLFNYENKISVNHYLIKRVNSFKGLIEPNMKLLLQVDFRYFITTSYLFSHYTPHNEKWNNVEYIDNDSNHILSLYGPIVYPPSKVNVFVFDSDKNSLSLIATGSSLKPNPDRVILHRKDITGHIHKNYRRYVVIKDMFDNADDVNYYKPVALRTKSGHSGHIVESVGTHGSMKCKFNGHQTQQEKVTMSLYKRVFPKWQFETVISLNNI